MDRLKIWLLLSIASIIMTGVFGEVGLSSMAVTSGVLALLFLLILLIRYVNDEDK